MRRLLRAFLIASVVALATALPIGAHQAPCGDPLEPEPGFSEYATHHVVPLAQERLLGAGGHIPGVEHRGYAGICGVLAP